MEVTCLVPNLEMTGAAHSIMSWVYVKFNFKGGFHGQLRTLQDLWSMHIGHVATEHHTVKVSGALYLNSVRDFSVAPLPPW